MKRTHDTLSQEQTVAELAHFAWYSLAATENAKDAVDALNALEALLEPDEIKAAQKLAREWSLRIAQDQNEVAR
ncbi:MULTISPECIES: hypothetical protein [Citrobacter]|uniref:hypothetical protein n=1 Tax=Citrobacter TaxID=544 RepID=UPI0011EF0604|nr:hypothetical protein [Citrobacter braakii]